MSLAGLVEATGLSRPDGPSAGGGAGGPPPRGPRRRRALPARAAAAGLGGGGAAPSWAWWRRPVRCSKPCGTRRASRPSSSCGTATPGSAWPPRSGRRGCATRCRSGRCCRSTGARAGRCCWPSRPSRSAQAGASRPWIRPSWRRSAAGAGRPAWPNGRTGVCSVSAPVLDSGGRVHAALGVSGPINRLGRQPGRQLAGPGGGRRPGARAPCRAGGLQRVKDCPHARDERRGVEGLPYR